MSSPILDDIRSNKNGRFTLPYSHNWTPPIWKGYFEDCSAGVESAVFEAGLQIGDRCQRLWQEIEVECQEYLPAVVFRSVVDEANVQFILRARHARKKIQEQLEDLDPFDSDSGLIFEDIADALSDLYFKYRKGSRSIALNFHLPDTVVPHLPSDRARRILLALERISALRFVFDRVLFVDASFHRTENSLVIRSISETSRQFLEKRCLATSVETDNQLGIARDISKLTPADIVRRAPYKVITEIDLSNCQTKPFFRSSEVYKARFYSRLMRLRGYVSSEYLFETLGENYVDVALTWDVLHSIAMSMAEVSPDDGVVRLATADLKKTELISTISHCLNITPRRARLAVESLMFDRPCFDGVWSRPIIPVDHGYVKLLYSAILSIDPARFLHLLIANLGIRDVRGKIFERKVVEQIEAFCGNSRFSRHLSILPRHHGIYDLLGRKKNETDFIAVIDNTVIIADVKSVTHVAGPREWYHAKAAVEKGFCQVSKRADKLIKYKKQACKLLGLRNLDVFTLVITNDRIFNGLSDGESTAIDIGSLITFIKSPEIKFGESLSDGHAEKVILAYQDADSFKQAIFKHIRSPLREVVRAAGLVYREENVDLGICQVSFDRYVIDKDKCDAVLNSIDSLYYHGT